MTPPSPVPAAMFHPSPRRILVICTRRIGDVLLTTPLMGSLRRAWPEAEVHALVFRGTEGVLAGNPDIDRVIAVPERSRWQQRLKELAGLWKRYDLAVSAVPSDRARIYGWAAARHRLGFAGEASADGGQQARNFWLDDALPFDDLHTHTVDMALQLADRLGIPRVGEVVPPRGDGSLPAGVSAPFAVLHPYPKFNYKMWRPEGWVALARALQERGLAVWLSGGPEAAEVDYCRAIAAEAGVGCLAGQLSLAATTDLLRQARLFVGPDTAASHLAAACGIPTLALFGPSNPVKWGPWPAGWQGPGSPWAFVGSGRVGNVQLLQGAGDCVPCRLEGCDRHTASYSRCLTEMTAERVIEVALGMLSD